MQEYHFTVEHIPGKQNIAADTLTRYPRAEEQRNEPRTYINSLNNLQLTSLSRQLQKQIKGLAGAQQTDKYINKIKQKKSEHITINNNIVFVRRNSSERWQVVIPDQLTHQIITETHESIGHPGKYKTYHLLKDMCTFKNMHRKIAATIRECNVC